MILGAKRMANATNSIALRADSIKASIGKTRVLMDVSASFRQGCWTSIVGPNGAGKSSFLKVLAGLLRCDGAVQLQGKSLAAWPRDARARQMSWFGQNEAASDDLSVYDVAMLARLPHQPWLSAASPEDHDVVESALRATHAWQWREKALGELSGGERQRVLLARALAVQAQVLLMDEPLANLDPPHQADWLAIVRALVAQGTTVISVLHEISMALRADDMLIMDRGQVTHQGACTDLATHQALEKVFDQRIRVVQVQDQLIALPN